MRQDYPDAYMRNKSVFIHVALFATGLSHQGVVHKQGVACVWLCARARADDHETTGMAVPLTRMHAHPTTGPM